MKSNLKKNIGKKCFLIMFFLLVVAVFAGAAEWQPYTSYSVGTVVTYNGASYTCRQNHRSLPGWEPPNALSLWLPGGTASTPTTAPNATSTPTQPAGSAPAGGKAVPGLIEAEAYNSMNGIQTESCSEGGTNVGWIDAGDWMDYAVNISTASSYRVEYRVAALSSSGSLDLRLDGASRGSATVPVTGGWQTWTTVSTTVSLSSGNHTIRLYVNSGGFNINWFRLSLSGSATSTPTPRTSTATPASAAKAVPGQIEAEAYNSMYGIQTESCSEGGTNVGWIDAGDWMDYAVNISTASSYRVEYRVAALSSSGSLDLRLDGASRGSVTVPVTGGWQTWTTVSATVSLSAGSHTIRLYVNSGGFNINWFSLSIGSAATPTPTRAPTSAPNPTVRPGGGMPGRVFAPYVDVCVYPTFSLMNCYNQTGQRYYTLAFIIANASNQPAWGGAYTMGENHMMSDISSLRSVGGDVIVSFGGANGFPIDYVISDVNSLVSAYQAIINQYGITWIDLDIEGWWVAESASIDRRNTAIARLQSANPGLRVTYCLPALPSGLTQDGLNVISNARSHGVNIYCVNVMAMDYGAYEAPNGDGGMGGYAVNAGSNTRNQVGTNIGVTPMIGMNDVQGEVFYIDDARELLNWANGQSYVNMLAMWSATRDNGGCVGVVSPTCSGISQSGFAFINAFKSFSR